MHWLEQHLAQYKGTVIAVTHDRYFLDNVAGWILELDRGRNPLERKLFFMARSKIETPRARAKTSLQATKNLGTGVGVDTYESKRPANQAKGPFIQL